MEYMTLKGKRKVSLVLLAVDDFTEQVITGSILRMYTKESRHFSISKPDGYHVFCDLFGDKVEICVESPLYQKQTVEFSLKDTWNVYQIRMLPNESYPIPSGATCVRGTVRPKSRVRFYFPEQKKSYKLLYDYVPQEQKGELALFCPEKVKLEGKTLYVRGTEEEGEFFRIKAQENEMCQLEQPLKKAYKKIGTSVYPVYETYADENGAFYLLIGNLPVESGTCTCLIAEEDGNEEECYTFFLKEGKENRLQFT